MIKSMTNMIFLMLLIGIFQAVCCCSFISRSDRKKTESQKYALLSGGGISKNDNLKSFYVNIEYVFNTLKKLGYRDENIKILFYGGKTRDHPIVEGNATKKNFIYELRHFERTINSNDSLLIFRSGHGIISLVLEKHHNHEDGLNIESIKCTGTISVMKFPDGDLSHLEFQKILKNINGKQIIVILNQCFAGQFTDIAEAVNNAVIITETGEAEVAFNTKRKTLRWKHTEWPFVKCIFDGFSENSISRQKNTVFDAYQYLLKCNPCIEGWPVHPDRPLLKESPKIKYGNRLKKRAVYLH
jgi:hypothetical protein